MKPQAFVVDRWVFGSLTYETSFALFRPRQLGEYRLYLLFIFFKFLLDRKQCRRASKLRADECR